MSLVIARILCRTAVAVSCAALPVMSLDAVAATSSTPTSLAKTAGDGELGHLGEYFPQALAVRVTDADGQPVSGVTVYFVADHCFGDGTVCNEPSTYPFFPGHTSDTLAVSDAQGIAVAPLLAAGDLAGRSDVVATIYADGPSSAVVATAAFVVWQVDGLAGVPITAGFTGAWYDPNQSGHGILVEVLPQNRLLAYWFTFDSDGNQAWFGGDGTILADQGIVNAMRGQGGQWIPNFDPAHVSLEQWGPLTFTFSDCNHGRVYFSYWDNSAASPVYWGADSMDLTRLTQPAGLSCP